MFYNAYLFTVSKRKIIGLGLTYTEAESECLTRAADVSSLERHGNTWFAPGYVPVLAMHTVQHDPFITANKGIEWV